MTIRIGGGSSNYDTAFNDTTAQNASVKTTANNAQTGAVQTQTAKLPGISGEVTFKVVGSRTEQQLARAALMAAASANGIASPQDQARFADSMLAKGKYDLKNITAKTEIADKDVPAMNNKRYTYVLSKPDRQELARFRDDYVAAGKKLVYAKNPIVNAQQTAGASAVADPNQPKNIKVKVTLPNTSEPLRDRALLGYAQQKYGQPRTNLWGDNIRNIRDLSKLQGVVAQNIKTAKMGDKTVAEFELTPASAAKVQKNYEAEQSEFNRAAEIADKFRNNNEAAAFLRGFGNGVWSALKSNWEMIKDPIGTAKSLFQMVTNPVETLEGIKKLIGDKWTEFQNADPSKKAEMLGNIAGELAVDALLTKGAGKVAKLSKAAEMLKGTKIGESIIGKADDVAAAARAKLAATFSDEAAAAASQRLKQKLTTQLYSGIPADALAEAAVIAGNKIAHGAEKFADFAKQMINEFGEKVKPELEKLYREAMTKFGKKVDDAEIAATKVDDIRSSNTAVSRLAIPQGFTEAQFGRFSQLVRDKVGKFGTDVRVQGSRAAGTASATSDIDIAVRVSRDKFDEFVKEAFKNAKPGTAAEKTMLHALKTGKIQRGELRLSGFGKELAKEFGLKDVDLSVILENGAFDQGPYIKLK